MRVSWLSGAVVLLAACAPNPAAPVKVMAIVPSGTGAYETRQVELTTITSITALKGSVVNLVGGAVIEINSADPQQQTATTDEEYALLLETNRGADVRANYIDKSGVLWPADFHSWSMVTTYFNYEQSFNYFKTVYDGKPTEELLGTKVFYWASFRNLDSGSDAEIHDNALWFPPVQAFLLVPFEKFQKVPFALNIGVIGHEYAHLVFNRKAFASAGTPAPLAGSSGWTLRPFNLLKSIDEGFADFHGYGVTCVAPGPGCRPAFLSASIADKAAVQARDISDDSHCLTEELRAALENFQPGQFITGGLHYSIGTLVATALYQAGNKNGQIEVLQKALVASYDDVSNKPGFKQVINLNLTTPAAFTPEKITDTIASHISNPELARLVCNQLVDRLQLMCDGYPCDPLNAGGTNPDNPLVHCPATTARGTTPCMALPRRTQ